MRRARVLGLPCGLRHCPLCPAPSLANIPEHMIVRLPDGPPPKRTRSPVRNGMRPEIKPLDQDEGSSSWSIIVRAMEGN